ncbi:MAG: response regulator transcription factor [Streptosporangiaceae bacterium]|nr:response regulator transcription factor [Streptosporangiaceae bacterium]
MAQAIDIAVVDDDLMLIEGIHAWTSVSGELRLTGAFPTVDDFLGSMTSRPPVVLLDLMLHDHSDPEVNVRRLAGAGHQVLIVSAWAEPDLVAAAFAAGARGCITKDKDLAVLAAAVRQIAAGETVYSQELASALLRDTRTTRPHLSAREREILMAYASGMTLDAAARHTGVKPGTAKTYLERVKAKYEDIGRPAYTKLELAKRVLEDWRHG